MPFWMLMLVALLNHSSFKANKVLISLFAIDLGASPATIGVLYAMYSLFPALLSVSAGKVSDRFGFRVPVMASCSGVMLSLILPFFYPELAALFVTAAVAGTCNIFYVVAIQHAIGAYGEGPARTRNYSLFAVCVGISALVGPVVSGFAIDTIGHRAAFLVIAAFPAVTLLMLAMRSARPLRTRPHAEPPARGRVWDLLRNAPLRRVLVATALLETGMELFNFLMPIYGSAIGLSASEIGIVMGTFALAMLVVRTLMTRLVRRSGEAGVFGASMLVAAVACVAFPVVSGFVPLLLMSFLLGLGLGCGAPLSMTLSYNRSPSGRAGEAIGLRQTVNKTMETVAPAFFGFLSAAVGVAPVYWFGALALACGGMLMRSDARRGKP